MYRRRPIVVQRRGPGLLRTAATTAVIAGTATAVSKGVSGSMEQAAMSKQQMEQQQVTQNTANQAQAELEQMKAQMAAMQAQQLQADQARATTAAAPSAQPDFIMRLQQLTQLKQSGALSEDEFQAAKAKLLSSS